VSEVVRLTLVSHAMTDAMAAGRFPADEPVNALGRNQIDVDLGATARVRYAFCGPETRARQTAQLLGLDCTVQPALADQDCGRWRGGDLAAVSAEDMTAWLTDPAAEPHGGESVVDLIGRVARWMNSLTAEHSPTVAVTHPAVVRAAVLTALDAPPTSFWRVDVAPVSRTVLHGRGRRWTLRCNR